jgi:acyl carrier protein phosphodiesterase
MNFLAHLHLAEPTPESRLGNLLGDFVKGYPWDDRFPEAVWRGIVEHRHVDAFTDSHPEWKRSRDLLPRNLRRFAGIVVDIFYDFFLHRHWSDFSPDVGQEEFIDSTHDSLGEALSIAPEEAREIIQRMIEQRWLGEYATSEGIERTLNRVSRRSPILSPLLEAAEVLESRLPELEEHFLAFYPDLLAYMPALRSEIAEALSGRLDGAPADQTA